jgi:peptidoglycan/LPS O-acetylase OafA/YrhL
MYKSLQGGRAIAAMLVVLFHLGTTMAHEKYFGIKAFDIPFSFGTAGIEFFFVLSGFIILTAHRNDIFQPHKLASYIRKRFVRIFPTYWIILLSVYFLSVFFSSFASSSWLNTFPHDVFDLLKLLLLIPQENGLPIRVAWTLQYEIFFYSFFTFLILSRWLSIIGGITLLYIYINYTRVSSFPLSFLSEDYILLFAMGMAVSVACTSKNMIVNRPVFYASIGALMFLFIALDTVIDFNLLMERRTILYGLAFSLIVFGLVQAEDKGRIIWGHSWMQILGDSSYALYLIHQPLTDILCKLSLLIHLNKLGIMGVMIIYFAVFGACLVSSVVFHLWIEKPIAAFFRNSRITPVFAAQ